MKNTVTKAVIPVAGMGTRFLPATKASPKEMIPLIDKPVIQYVVEEAVASGIKTIIMITGWGKQSIENHFDYALELEAFLKEKGKGDRVENLRAIADLADFVFIRQGDPGGLGHAVSKAKSVINNEPFAVLLGDDIVDSDQPCLAQLTGVYNQKKGPVVAVEEVPWETVHRYGILTPEEAGDRTYRIKDLVEKPNREKAPSNLAIIGRYILEPDIFDDLEATPPGRGGEIQLTDALKRQIQRRDIYGYMFHGRRFDAGDKLGFLIATVEYALRHPEFGSSFKDYLKTIDL